MGLANEDGYPIVLTTKQYDFLMNDYIRLLDSSGVTLDVFCQLRSLPSRMAFELKNWVSDNDVVYEAVLKDCKSINNKKQDEVRPNTAEVSSVLGLHWTATNDIVQMYQ